MIILYRFLYVLLRVFLSLTSPLHSDSLRQWLSLRTRRFESVGPRTDLWIHASSGEIEYAKAVIRLFKERHKNSRVVVTYSSPSAEKLFENIRAQVDEFIPLPWDQPKPILELIRYCNAKILVFSRTDLWPELIYQATQASVPLGLLAFNPRFSGTTRLLYRRLLSAFRFISCVERTQAEELNRILNRKDITADGDTRFDQVFYRLEQTPKLSFAYSSRRIVFGSTWPQDEKFIFPILRNLRKDGYRVILSPHDVSPENISRAINEVQHLGLSAIKMSAFPDLNDIPEKSDVVIIDRIGYLADAYRGAAAAFVGGSFKDKVHSVMEPLCCGCPVVLGPHFNNNPEAVRYLNKWVFSAHNSIELERLVRSSSELERTVLLSDMQSNRNSSNRVAAVIERIFEGT